MQVFTTAYHAANGRGAALTWPDLKQALMTSLSTIDKQALARRLLPVITQGGSSIGGYIAEFNRLLTEHGPQQPN